MERVHRHHYVFLRRLQGFAADESGAVAADWAFLTASLSGMAVAVVTSVSTGTQDLSGDLMTRLNGAEIIFASRNFGRDRLEVLLQEGMENLSDSQTTVRYTRFSDPGERTDAQVRNAHRTWSRRAADYTYSNQPRARDMVRILESAMDLRGIEPHDDI